MKHPQTGKNKGYAFVRFAAVEQAKKAATELGRTKVRILLRWPNAGRALQHVPLMNTFSKLASFIFS
jgi:RNA recognition motif-containing protein